MLIALLGEHLEYTSYCTMLFRVSAISVSKSLRDIYFFLPIFA
ncbi:Uncharacterised protein [Vibrio cholerae]|nr:Uncharacterised protein [Vibrio cholerae]CSI22990.1 Uncharacterised protein [Vibrio cholerae]